MSRLACGLLAALFFPFVAQAQTYARNYTVRVWNTAEGLPQSSGTAFVRTSDGYLWVGTFNGLVRFNGVDFSRYTVANVREFPTDDINGLHEDRSGRLWIGTYLGLVSFESGRFKHWKTPEKLGRAVIRMFVEESDGALLVSTDRGIWRMKDDRATEIQVPGAKWPGWSWIASGTGTDVWAAQDSQLYRMVGDHLESELAFDSPIKALAVSRDGTVWCGYGDKLAWYKPGQKPVEAPFQPGEVRVLLESQNGGWWIGTTRAGLYHWEEGAVTPLTIREGLPSDRILALDEDGEGNLWVGTDGGGFCRVTPAVLKTYDSRHGLTDNDVISIIEDRDGRIWLGTFGGALCVGTEGRWQRFAPLDPIRTNENVLALCQTRDGTIWVGRTGGPLCKLINGRLEEDHRSLVGAVRVLLEDRDGGLWAGSQNAGVEYLSTTDVRRWNMTNGLSHNFVTAAAQDADGTIWIGTQNGLNRILAGRVQTYHASDGLGANQIHSLFTDRDGVLWIGTAGGGLTRYRGGRFSTVTSQHGLQSDVIAQILEHNGDFWIGSTTGISRVNKQSLHDVLDGRTRMVRSATYGKKDGMLASGCPGGFQPTCTTTRDGRLWFCTSGGVTVLDPRELPTPAFAPPVHVERILIDGLEISRRDAGGFLALASGIPPNATRNHSSNGQNAQAASMASNGSSEAADQRTARENSKASDAILIPPRTQRLEFHCAALNLASPERAHYRFWLENYDDTWQEAGTRRVAYYNRVPPGEYRFHVRAMNADGATEESQATLSFIVRPSWRQTWWYRSALAFSVLGVLGVFYHNRVNRLKQDSIQQAEFARQLIDSQEAERKRIATELHDSLGQSLLIIKNQARRSARISTSIDELHNCLNEIAQTAGEAVEDVRGIARALRPYQLDTLGLKRALQGLINQSAEAGNLKVHLTLDEIDGRLPPQSEINVFRIVQESLSNVAKHSDATELNIVVRAAQNSICLSVEDNGRGFDVESTRQAGGFGLRGIEERVRLLGGHWRIESAPGNGAKIRIELPCSNLSRSSERMSPEA